MERGKPSLPLPTELFSGRSAAAPVWGVRRRRAHRSRWVPILFYLALLLVNIAVLSFATGGGLGLGIAHFLDRVSPLEENASGETRLQYPPGENWGNGDATTAQPMPNG